MASGKQPTISVRSDFISPSAADITKHLFRIKNDLLPFVFLLLCHHSVLLHKLLFLLLPVRLEATVFLQIETDSKIIESKVDRSST